MPTGEPLLPIRKEIKKNIKEIKFTKWVIWVNNVCLTHEVKNSFPYLLIQWWHIILCVLVFFSSVDYYLFKITYSKLNFLSSWINRYWISFSNQSELLTNIWHIWHLWHTLSSNWREIEMLTGYKYDELPAIRTRFKYFQ